jgi:hypothetical protein
VTEGSFSYSDAGWAHRASLVNLQPNAAANGTAVSADDRAAINEVFARYAIAYDERRFDVLASCFHDDASYEVWLGDRRVSKFEGRQAIVDGIESVIVEQGTEQRRHHIGNIVLDTLGPAAVLATAYANVVIIGAAGVAVQASAIYHAELARRDGAWRFTKVVVGLDGYMGKPPER